MPFHLHIIRCTAPRCKKIASVVLCNGAQEAVILCFKHGNSWLKRLNEAERKTKAEAKVELQIPAAVNSWIN